MTHNVMCFNFDLIRNANVVRYIMVTKPRIAVYYLIMCLKACG